MPISPIPVLGSKFPVVLDLDHEIQSLRDLTGCEVVSMSIKKATAARGFRIVADSTAGEKPFHVRVCNLRFQAFDVEAGFRPIDASRTLFFLDLEPALAMLKTYQGVGGSIRNRLCWHYAAGGGVAGGGVKVRAR